MGLLHGTLKWRNPDASIDLNKRLFGVVSKGIYDGDPQNPPAIAPIALKGTVHVTNGSSAVVGTSTSFDTQLVAGNLVTFGTDPTIYEVNAAPPITATTFSTTVNYGAASQLTAICYRVYPASPFSVGAFVPHVVPGPGALQVSVLPFVAMSADGMLISHEGTPQVLTVAASTVQYVVCRAKYLVGSDPVITLEVLTSAAYAADVDRAQVFLGQPVDYLIVLAKIASTVGPITTTHLTFNENHIVNSIGRNFLRGHVTNLATLNSTPLNDPKIVVTGDIYLAMAEKQFYQWSGAAWQAVGDQIMLTTLTQHLAVSGPGAGGFAVRDGFGYPSHPANAISFTQTTGNVTSGTVQAALDAKVVAKVGDTMTGTLNINSPISYAIVASSNNTTAAQFIGGSVSPVSPYGVIVSGGSTNSNGDTGGIGAYIIGGEVGGDFGTGGQGASINGNDGRIDVGGGYAGGLGVSVTGGIGSGTSAGGAGAIITGGLGGATGNGGFGINVTGGNADTHGDGGYGAHIVGGASSGSLRTGGYGLNVTAGSGLGGNSTGGYGITVTAGNGTKYGGTGLIIQAGSASGVTAGDGIDVTAGLASGLAADGTAIVAHGVGLGDSILGLGAGVSAPAPTKSGVVGIGGTTGVGVIGYGNGGDALDISGANSNAQYAGVVAMGGGSDGPGLWARGSAAGADNPGARIYSRGMNPGIYVEAIGPTPPIVDSTAYGAVIYGGVGGIGAPGSPGATGKAGAYGVDAHGGPGGLGGTSIGLGIPGASGGSGAPGLNSIGGNGGAGTNGTAGAPFGNGGNGGDGGSGGAGLYVLGGPGGPGGAGGAAGFSGSPGSPGATGATGPAIHATGSIVWTDGGRGQFRKTSPSTINPSGTTPFSWDVVEYSTGGIVLDTGDIKIVNPGTYMLNVTIVCKFGDTGANRVEWYLKESGTIRGSLALVENLSTANSIVTLTRSFIVTTASANQKLIATAEEEGGSSNVSLLGTYGTGATFNGCSLTIFRLND